MKIDAAMLVQNPVEAESLAADLEEMGFTGAYTFEGQHDPFFPLALAARKTQHLELITAIAVAFARNPMTLANTAYDLQLLSQGRFILGLGTQIKPHIEKRFSMQWSRPAARMREMVQAIRAIWASWETGERLAFNGEFYTHTVMGPTFNPGPNPYGTPKIFLAGFGERMVEVVGEVADGFLVHPLNTRRFLTDYSLPALEKGLAKSGRSRDSIEVSCQVMTALGNTEEEVTAARQMVKGMISFYGSTPAYKPALDIEGWGDLQPKLNTLSKEGKWDVMSSLITDDMVDAVAVVGTPEQAAEQLRERYGDLVDRISPVVYSGDRDILRGLARHLSA